MSTDAVARQPTVKPELYSKEILRLASALPHGDHIDGADATARCRSPVCGSEITTDVQLDDDGRIAALAFRARACAMGQASAALLRSSALGRTASAISEARAALAQALAGQAGFDGCWPELAIFEAAQAHPGRHAAILLPYDAVIAALAEIG